MRRGEVWWAEARPKRRPVVVLTRDPAIPLVALVTVAPTTTRVRRIPTEIALDERDGMPRPCVVALDALRTLPKSALKRRITQLSDSRMNEICERLAYALGC